MKSTVKIVSLLALLSFAAPCFVSAADAPAAAEKTAEPKKAKGKYTGFYAQVDTITAALLTVKGNGETKFVINADSKISKDKAGKEPATIADVKVGQWIGGSYTKGADGSNLLHSLHLDVSQDGPKGKKKKEAK